LTERGREGKRERGKEEKREGEIEIEIESLGRNLRDRQMKRETRDKERVCG
jgi:hypothetical protein